MLDLLATGTEAQNATPPAWALAVTIGLLVAVVTAPLIIISVMGGRRARRLVDDWARVNGTALQSVRAVCSYQRGPFRMASRAASVFHIATTKDGRARPGYLNMNNTFLWGYRPEVRWDDSAP